MCVGVLANTIVNPAHTILPFFDVEESWISLATVKAIENVFSFGLASL